jgi:tetratricopeptide (TPR) repeat protein
MRRITILTVSLLAVLSAFAQTPPPKGAAAPAAPAAAPAAPAGPHMKSKAEGDALGTMLRAQDPDSRIKGAEDLLSGFPDTDYRAMAFQVEADAYHMKKDDAKAIALSEQVLQIDPKNSFTLLMLADIYSQTTRSTDLDMNERLTKADQYAKDAMTILEATAKTDAKMSDADWDAIKKGEEARALEAMGLTAILRNKLDDAKTDLQKSIEYNPDPFEMLRIGRAYATARHFDDAIGWDDKVAASAAPDNIKRIAASDKTRAEAQKKQQ